MDRLETLRKKLTYKHVLVAVLLVLLVTCSIFFVYHNYSFYDRPIAKVTETNLVDKEEVTAEHGNKDEVFTQEVVAEIMNGANKGEELHLTNEYSASATYSQEYRVGNDLFVSIDPDNANAHAELTGTILDVKRDKYIVLVAWVFVFILLLVGKKQGLYSVISLAINAVLISYALDMYIQYANFGLLLMCACSVVLFTLTSLLLVNGFNEKTYAAIAATLLGTLTSLLITYLVMWITSEKGLRYEEMGFLTRPPQMVFMAGILIGSLGAVMDVAITMSSSIFGLYEKKTDIAVKALKTSGMEIGKDIMGTMTNILFFAYISGSIPTMILYLKNEYPVSYTFSMNLSLELARALAGGIGIVLTIPIGLYTAIFFVNRKRAKS
ncbi:YibE/F family protein [Sediminibacillus dalangtanensis]|uniref:YibE/F family protein n=1 Tax=Sediminibacillus dalangtanensis TaxID=2729421 RepID=A0ABX7W1W6_9BACI|nr:YibE/F family protein [Sediminibacillus dalangtanensis]QTN01412.1 YibE/F family protein [Sediminibacillus dalangtanensis]